VVGDEVVTRARQCYQVRRDRGEVQCGDVGVVKVLAEVRDRAESPGLRVAQSAATRTITVDAAASRNFAFSRDAILLGTRLPEVGPTGADLAIMRETITDPFTGISFELSVYPGGGCGPFRPDSRWSTESDCGGRCRQSCQ